jgi:hypothetical protein
MSVQWTGNLRDDCTAHVGELCLRVEMMAKGKWWWAVYNKRGGIGCDQLAASYDTKPYNATTGAKARAACEAAAQRLAGKPGEGRDE